METIQWFKMSAYIRNASEQLYFFCKSCRLPGCDRSHWKDSMHFKVRPFISSWDNEVIIHWTTVLLKWVSFLKLLHHDVHIVWWTGFFLISVIFTSGFLLPFSVTCIFVLCDKMDVEAWNDCQWFCKGAGHVWNYFAEFISLGFFLIKSSQQPRCLSEM